MHESHDSLKEEVAANYTFAEGKEDDGDEGNSFAVMGLPFPFNATFPCQKWLEKVSFCNRDRRVFLLLILFFILCTNLAETLLSHEGTDQNGNENVFVGGQTSGTGSFIDKALLNLEESEEAVIMA